MQVRLVRGRFFSRERYGRYPAGRRDQRNLRQPLLGEPESHRQAVRIRRPRAAQSVDHGRGCGRRHAPPRSASGSPARDVSSLRPAHWIQYAVAGGRRWSAACTRARRARRNPGTRCIRTDHGAEHSRSGDWRIARCAAFSSPSARPFFSACGAAGRGRDLRPDGSTRSEPHCGDRPSYRIGSDTGRVLQWCFDRALF